MALSSISSAINAAISGLQFNQTALRLTANNIANANTEGYSRQVVTAESLRITGAEIGSGVRVASITRTVDNYLLGNLRTQTSTLGDIQAQDRFLQQMEDLFGTPGGNNAITHSLGALRAALESAAITPEGIAERINVINAATDLTQQLNSMASQIQTMRKNAEADIGASVSIVNAQLAIVADLNGRISKDTAIGRAVSELEDQRDIAIAKVAEQIDIRYYTRETGEIVLVTPQGRQLADTSAKTMAFAAASQVNASISYLDGIAGITLDGADITAEISGGRIAGLVQMRDTDLVNFNAEIDRLSQVLSDQINALHNDGAGYPAATTLTGTRNLAAGTATAFAGSGTVRIAVVNADGTFAATPLDLDLTTLPSPATVNDVIGAINTGLTGFATASVVNNKLVITADNTGDSIALNESTSQVVNFRSKTLATTALGEAGTFNIYDSTNTLLGTVTVLTSDTATDIQASITAIAGVTATILTESTGKQRIDILSDNGLSLTMTDVTGTVASNLDIVDSTRGFSHYFGLNDFFVGDDAASLASTIAVRSDLITNPERVSRGELSSLASGSVVAGTTPALAVGDNSVADRLAARFTQQISFASAGGLSGVSNTLEGYGASIIARVATLANNAIQQKTYTETIHQRLTTQTGQISGVSIDEELANTVIFQNAYAASARMISTLSDILDILSDLV